MNRKSCSADANLTLRQRLERPAGLLLASWLLASTLAAVPPEAAPPSAANSPQGFLYGKVTTRSGTTYQGRLRWDGEEAFWGDHFDASKEELPYQDMVPRAHRSRREPIKVFGITIGIHWNDSGRQLVAQFGDLREIRRSRHGTLLVLRNGTEIEVDDSGDADENVVVWDPGVGEIELDEDSIDKVEFLPTPADLRVDVQRLYGTVYTTQGEFRGFIQWDRQECVTSDKLDGESRDGDLSLEMGKIRTIARRSHGSSRIVLKDGRELILDGTNDVDDDNRGIFVEDPRFGRVLVEWSVFDRLEFADPPGSGPSYAEFLPGRPLRGTVTTKGGQTAKGQLVYDVDESETWELLNGKQRGLEYSIPLAKVAAVVPKSDDSSQVILRSGLELELGETADVDENNAGIVVLKDGSEPQYIPWEEVTRIDFE